MRFDDHPYGRKPDAASDRIVLERGARRITVRLPRHGVAACAVLVLGLGGWSIASAAYMLFHDTVVAEISQNAKMSERGYQAQIAAMRDEIERMRTRRMVEKAGLDERISELHLRQNAVEKRQLRLAELAGEPVADFGRDAISEQALAYADKPSPLDGPARAFDSVGAMPDSGRALTATERAERVAAALDTVEVKQTKALEGLAQKTRERRQTLERVYDAAGVPKPRLAAGDGKGRGGPYEPLPASALTFDLRVQEIAAERATVQAFERGLDAVPLRTPSPGSGLSSGFGARTDPFLGSLAFHAGVDFEAGMGAPAKATAAGKVVSAGWSGGYGNMVEIDHGAGLTTRYGHLSAIGVTVGERVASGEVIGRVGSTGRSTGPHLHYETRVDGQAVTPLRFLNAGRLLAKAK